VSYRNAVPNSEQRLDRKAFAMPSPIDDPAEVGPALIETLLRHAPRDADGEVTGTLIALHGAVRGWWQGGHLGDRGADTMAAMLQPIEALLGRYRPRTLFGLRRLLDLIAADLDLHGEERAAATRRAWVAAARDSAHQLARLELHRTDRQGIERLRLDSPLVGEPFDSPRWARDAGA
jgi:hypothetical protein